MASKKLNNELYSIANASIDGSYDDINAYHREVMKKNKINDFSIKKTEINIDTAQLGEQDIGTALDFKWKLPREFNNVKKIQILSTEIPLTKHIINSSNKYIYWQNEGSSTIHSVALTEGSFTEEELVADMTAKMSTNYLPNYIGTGIFVITVDNGKFTFKQAAPLDNSASTGILTTWIYSSNTPGYRLNLYTELQNFSGEEWIYISKHDAIGKYTEEDYIGFHPCVYAAGEIQIFNPKVYWKLGMESTRPFNTLVYGKVVPFKFLWGDYDNTVASILGFNATNSTEYSFTQTSDVLSNVDGDSYGYITSSTTGTTLRTNDNVDDVFACIQYSSDIGSYIYNSFIGGVKIFDTPLRKMDKIHLALKAKNGEEMSIMNFNWSITLQIMEYIDIIKDCNFSSRRGQTDKT
jgi:hypothetical protein